MRRLSLYLPSLLALAAAIAAWVLLRHGLQGAGRPAPPPPLDFTAERQALSESVAEYRPDHAASLHDLAGGCLFVGGLPGASWLTVTQAQARDGPTTRIVHVVDYHWVPEHLYHGALPYDEFLDRVELVQEQHAAMLTALAKYHGLTGVWQEGLTEEGLADYRAAVDALRGLWGQRRRVAALLRAGAPGEGEDAVRAVQRAAALDQRLGRE